MAAAMAAAASAATAATAAASAAKAAAAAATALATSTAAAAAATTAAAGAEAEAEEDAAAAAGGMWAAPTTPQSIERGKQHLVIIRHGKTEHNKLGLFTGWEDVSLAPEGRIEATRAPEGWRISVKAGSLGPGGGFQGGVILAAAYILYALIYGVVDAQKVLPRRVTDVAAALVRTATSALHQRPDFTTCSVVAVLLMTFL